jgi:hypothetical protein
MGIGGYAVVIVVMEAFNFSLSAVRLYKKVPFKINIAESLVLPLFSSLFAAGVCKGLFLFNGAEASPIWLILKLTFAVSVFISIYVPIKTVLSRKKAIA